MGDFGLSDALGEADTVELLRRQRGIAWRYQEHEAYAWITKWLIENGYEPLVSPS